MPVIITILILINFSSICYQDLKSREVYLANYISLFLLYIFLIYTGGLQIIAEIILLNICILIATVSLLFVYYIVRYKTKAFKKVKASIGLGDLLILPVFIISFSPFNFILIYMISLFVSLTYFIVFNLHKNQLTIPLAGIQSIVLTICLIIHITGLFNMHTDIYPLL